MKRHFKSFLLLIGIILPFLVQGQQPLSLKSAIDTALRNNFDIRISRNNVEIARINNSYGVAGGLPYITASAGDNLSVNNSLQEFSDNTEINLDNQRENAVNAGVSAGIVLFNGFKVIATKERLSRLENLSEIQLNQQVQATIGDVMITFHDIIRQQNYLKIIQNSLDVSNQKLDIINVKSNVGMADAAEVLQAQSDVNSAEQLLALQETVIEQNKADLLLLISAKTQFPFSILDTITVDPSLKLDSILDYLNRNPQYLSAEQQILIDQQLVKEVSAQRYPSVKLNAGYDLYQTDLSKGNTLMSRNYGPTAGITLQVPVFNGFIYKTQKEVAKIRVDNSMLAKESLLYSLSAQASNLYRSYSTTLQQLESQQLNFEMTRQLVEVVLHKFNLGQATILDVKAAQSSFENAAYLLINLKYSAKVAEIELKQLIYKLEY